MKVKVEDKEYFVTDMVVMNRKVNRMKYNVFDDKYNFVTSIDCEDEIDFMQKFNNFLKQNG